MRQWTRYTSTALLKELTKVKGFGQSRDGYAGNIKNEVEKELRRRNKRNKKDYVEVSK